MNTIFELQRYASQELKDTYDKSEVRVLCSLLFQHILQYTNVDIYLKKNELIEKRFVNIFLEALEKLKAHVPIQYILGETDFAGCSFRLNSSTLIPRPETEELVVWMEEEVREGQRVLDVGTGSGCIAISLAKRRSGLHVSGMDISSEALQQARENAVRNAVEVAFSQWDILASENWPADRFEVIVSNPPYVRESERQWMQRRVLDYEPERALFVPDEDPLLFYRAISRFAAVHLEVGGLLFLEINEAFGSEMVALLEEEGFHSICLRQDIHGKDRFVRGVWGSKTDEE